MPESAQHSTNIFVQRRITRQYSHVSRKDSIPDKSSAPLTYTRARAELFRTEVLRKVVGDQWGTITNEGAMARGAK